MTEALNVRHCPHCGSDQLHRNSACLVGKTGATPFDANSTASSIFARPKNARPSTGDTSTDPGTGEAHADGTEAGNPDGTGSGQADPADAPEA